MHDFAPLEAWKHGNAPADQKHAHNMHILCEDEGGALPVTVRAGTETWFLQPAFETECAIFYYKTGKTLL